MPAQRHPVIIVGAGFTGLTAALRLAQRGVPTVVLERDEQVGGLASDYTLPGGQQIERFYHHWFTSDQHVMDLIGELGLSDRVVVRPTNTGLYFANTIFRLSSPLDLLRFSPLPIWDRIRLGWMALAARRVKDWRSLEGVTSAEWLRRMGGDNVYKIVWEPLLRGKFGPYADRIGAVWFWNKLKLRGSSRGAGSAEELAYFKGGFGALAREIAISAGAAGASIETGRSVQNIVRSPDGTLLVETDAGPRPASDILITIAPPLAAELLAGVAGPGDTAWLNSLRSIDYLANTCLVLELDRPLSQTYWLNVNDPSFPFVGIIEHTNFEPATSYGGRHVVYLSKYLAVDHPMWAMDADATLAFALPHLQRMFPAFSPDWILAHRVWKARWAQPIVTAGYSQIVPAMQTPVPGCWLATMAQIYPEDRGTNYAIRDGAQVAGMIASALNLQPGVWKGTIP
ncbi:oxidoreductase [Planctomycetota bacterium]|nr:oxidoreductase [Planctomycetota bacterium]